MADSQYTSDEENSHSMDVTRTLGHIIYKGAIESFHVSLEYIMPKMFAIFVLLNIFF